MKTIRNILMCIAILFGKQLVAQSWSIIDPVVAAEKVVITGELAAEIVLKNQQSGLLTELTRLEKQYEKKRNAVANFRSTEVMAVSQSTVLFTVNKISAVKTKINNVRINPLHLRHGLRRYEKILETEERYLNRIRDEITILSGGILLSGSAGYNYTAFIKVLIRTLEIRANVLKIENDIDNLQTLNNVFIK